MLCRICQDIIRSKKDCFHDDDGTIFCIQHPTGASFQTSAADGCHICATVWSSLGSSQRDFLLQLDAKDPITNIMVADPQILLESPTISSIFGSDSLMILFHFDVEPDFWNLPGGVREKSNIFVLQPSERLSDFTLTTPAGDNTSSIESWKLASQWFDTCISQHPRCTGIKATESWYPTRLIDIGDSSANDVHLRVTSRSPPTGPYITLSHCWGTSKFLRLTSSSLADLEQSIPRDDLPLTFRQAFEVTRRLGLRYIWIDSLCIIQDSKEDWLHEAALMHKVYSQSYCTIAAAASADSSQGLFRQREPHFLHPAEIDVPWFNPNYTGKYQLIDYGFWTSHIQYQPLHQRGWVVQERLLPPRVLHFSSEQLIWECHELDAAEKYPRGLPKVLSASAQALFKGLDAQIDGARIRKLSGEHDTDPKFYGLHLWSKIVEAYSSSLLTYEDDKLIALSGIAKTQQEALGVQYIAGLWNQWLPSQLLWHVEKCRKIDNSPSRRPDKYRAPSWSWASVDGVIRPGSVADDGFLIDIVEVNVHPATSDPTGLVDGGFLRIRGVLKELQLKRDELIPNYWWMSVNGVEVRHQGDNDWEKMGPSVHLDVNDTDLTGMKFCVPFREPSRYNSVLSGLIFERTGKTTREFRRIGMFDAVGEELHPMIMARNKNESSLPCESFDTETQTHTICIV